MKKIIIDTDTASDDAVALIYALRQASVKVEAVTVVAGNLALETCLKNALISVERAGTYAPPVFPGAAGPLLRPLFTSEFVHGKDGMGNMDLPNPGLAPAAGHAVDAILERVSAAPGEIDLITLGPLTNVALAVRQEPQLVHLLRSLWVMGGAGRGPGNITPVAEFNIYVDAEAAQIVLDAGMNPVFVGWDVSTSETFINEQDMRRLEDGSDTARFTLRCNRSLIEHNAKAWGGKVGFDLPDPVAMAAALHPELIEASYRAFCAVSLRDELTYGQLVIDRDKLLNREPNATLIERINARRFKESLFESLMR